MKKVFAAAALAAFAAGATSGYAQTVLFEENFDDVADIPALLAKPGWESSAVPVSISTERSVSGAQSLRHEAATTGNVIANLGGGFSANDEGVGDGALLASIWIYIDDITQASDSSLVLAGWADDAWGAGALENFLVIGTYSFSPAADHEHYVSRVVFGSPASGAPDQGWVAGDPDPVVNEAALRKADTWVHLAIFAESLDAKFYVDGVMIRDSPYTPATFDSIRIGAAAGAPMATDVYWDDLEVVQGASAPEPTSVQEWHLF